MNVLFYKVQSKICLHLGVAGNAAQDIQLIHLKGDLHRDRTWPLRLHQDAILYIYDLNNNVYLDPEDWANHQKKIKTF
jgi:hypothetical protein